MKRVEIADIPGLDNPARGGTFSRVIDPRHDSKPRTLSTVGILLLGVAVLFGLYGLVSFSHGFLRPSSESFADPNGVMDEDRSSGFIGITCMAIGGFALIAGLKTLAFAKVGAILRYASAEATPVAVDTFNHAVDGAQDGIELSRAARAPSALVGVVLTTLGCAPHTGETAASGAATSTATRPEETLVEAYPSARPRTGTRARVRCEDARGAVVAWSDVWADGADEPARRVCEVSARDVACPPELSLRRVERTCGTAPLGPGPRVARSAVILRRTHEAPLLPMLLDAAGTHRPLPKEVASEVTDYVVLDKAEACASLAAELSRAERVRAAQVAEDERSFLSGQAEQARSELDRLRQELAEFERNHGGPIASREAELKTKFERTHDAAARERIQRDLVELTMAEIEDRRLRDAIHLNETILAAVGEQLKGVRPREARTDAIACIAPGVSR